MKRSPLPRRTTSLRSTRGAQIRREKIKATNPARRAKSFARTYGSKERCDWISSLPCAWCVLRGLVRISRPSDNAHSEGGGGMGMKAGYATIVPLCRRHHEQYDQHRAPFDTLSARACVRFLAEHTEAAWQQYSLAR